MIVGQRVRLTSEAKDQFPDLAHMMGRVTIIAEPRAQVSWSRAGIVSWLPIADLELTDPAA